MALSEQQIKNLWVAQGGDPKAAGEMAQIALRESGGRPGINNRGTNKNGTVDWGLFQVNDIWRKDPYVGKLFQSGAILTPAGGTKAAIYILKKQGPQAWATYNPSTDAKYLSGLSGGGGKVTTGGGGASTVTKRIPGVDHSADRLALISQFVQQGGADNPNAVLGLAGSLPSVLTDTPARTVTKTVKRSAPAAASSSSAPTGGAPHAHGQWGGSAGPVLGLFKRFGKPLGLQIMSEKRNNTNPYSGSRSDHDFGNKSAFAVDASNGGSPTPEMDRYAFQVMHALGFKDYKLGQPINTSQGVTTIDGVRYQVIYRGSGAAYGGNHLNHVHVGAHRA